MDSNLQRLSDTQLFESAHSAVKEERRAILEVLLHLRAIDDRKLYLDRGYPSLFEFCVKEFAYSNGAAQRRIQAMRLAKSVPEVQEKIASGQVTITSAASIQSFLQNEKREGSRYTKSDTLELIEACSGKSSREVEKELATRNPEFAMRDSVRAVDADHMRVTFNVSDKLWRKFEQLKALRSHANSPASNEELLNWLVELGLDKADPVRRAERSKRRKAQRDRADKTNEDFVVSAKIDSKKTSIPSRNATILSSSEPVPRSIDEPTLNTTASFDDKALSLPAPDEAACRAARSRYITARERHLMAPSRKSGCGFIDPIINRRCGATHYLQLDHLILFSEGGANTAANLQWRCGQHNRRSYENSRVDAPVAPYGVAPYGVAPYGVAPYGGAPYEAKRQLRAAEKIGASLRAATNRVDFRDGFSAAI